MKAAKSIFLIIFLVIICKKSFAQDSLNTLNVEQLLTIVRNYHPIARQANIEIEKSTADILIAKGAFDPILSNYLAKKTFDGKKYYSLNTPEVRIPTWYGIEVVAGLENLEGNRYDVAETVGKTNYFGISIPLAKNLVIDKRRAYLQQAKVFNKMALAEQRVTINNLLIEAVESYWQWVKAYQIYLVITDNVVLNQRRVDFVKKSFLNGERAAIDTLEATAQLQSFQNQQYSYWLAFQKAGLELSVFLWQNNNEPYYLPASTIPQTGWENETNIANFNLDLESLEEIADKNHPILQAYEAKQEVLTIDKKLKFQDLLPKLDFRYNQLGKGYKLLETAVQAPLFENNFQYGLKFEMPLQLRQGRGDYQKAKLKLEENQLDINQKSQQIQLKLKVYFAEFTTLKNQIALQSSNYDNYRKLVTAEETRLLNGESSLFLVNSRENKAIEALEKLIELKTKYYKTIYGLQWAAGILY